MMTCVAIGLLLRVSYELDRAERQRAVRQETAPATGASAVAAPAPAAAPASRPARKPQPAAPARAPQPVAATTNVHGAAVGLRGRGTSRVEPTFGGFS